MANAKNARLFERLRRRVARFGNSRESMTIEQKLTDEALTFARMGDFDEARYRIRLRDKPKWQSEQECRAAYDAAMKEKRGREMLL